MNGHCDVCSKISKKLIKKDTSGGTIRICSNCENGKKSVQRKILSKNFGVY